MADHGATWLRNACAKTSSHFAGFVDLLCSYPAAGARGEPGSFTEPKRRQGHAISTPAGGDMSNLARLRIPTRSRNFYIGAGFAALLAGLAVGQAALDKTAAAQAQGAVMAPRFEVDPLWPKPLPNHWVLGSTIGVWVDTDDHVWIIHRSSATLANNEK